jgi:hypothetical protein
MYNRGRADEKKSKGCVVRVLPGDLPSNSGAALLSLLMLAAALGPDGGLG